MWDYFHVCDLKQDYSVVNILSHNGVGTHAFNLSTLTLCEAIIVYQVVFKCAGTAFVHIQFCMWLSLSACNMYFPVIPQLHVVYP